VSTVTGASLYWDLRIALRAIGLGPHLPQGLRHRLRLESPPPAPVTVIAAGDAPNGRVGAIVEADGIRLRLDAALDDAAIDAILTGRHTHEERRVILGALAPDDVVLELGGGIGMVAIACARVIGSARVFSIEANAGLRPQIEANYRLNGVAPTIEFGMVGPRAGMRTFYVAANFKVSSSVSVRGASRATRVQMKSLAETLDRIRPTFLIVDIEGGEYDLLVDTALPGVRKVFLETHPHLIGIRRTNAVRRALRRQGFAEHSTDGRHFLYRRRPTLVRWKTPK
jgi:FkbM family methyltransferase